MALFYRYDKEGPGVSKDQPKKKVFFEFFEVFFRYVWKLMPVNFVCCLLMFIPAGFSAVGMTYIARSVSRGKHTFGFSDFFSAIKKNFKQALGIGLLNNVMTFLLCYAIYYYYYSAMAGKALGIISLGVSLFILLYFTMMKFYMWFMVITFNMRASVIYKNSFKFVIINLKNNGIMMLCLALFWGLGLFAIIATGHALAVSIFGVILLFFYPTFYYLLVSYGIFDSIKKCIIDPYYEEHPDDDIEFRRNLGLDVGDDDEEDFEE